MYKIYITLALCVAVCLMPANAAPVVDQTAMTEAAQKKCVDAYNTCRSTPGANLTICASNVASCLKYNPFGPDGSFKLRSEPLSASTAPSPPTKGPAAGPALETAVQRKCSNAVNACRGKSDANLSICASEYKACLGQ